MKPYLMHMSALQYMDEQRYRPYKPIPHPDKTHLTINEHGIVPLQKDIVLHLDASNGLMLVIDGDTIPLKYGVDVG